MPAPAQLPLVRSCFDTRHDQFDADCVANGRVGSRSPIDAMRRSHGQETESPFVHHENHVTKPISITVHSENELGVYLCSRQQPHVDRRYVQPLR